MKIFKTCIHVLLFTVKSSICCKESTSYSVFYFWRKHIFKRVTDRHGDILIGRGLILNELHIVAMITVTVIVKHCCGSLSQTCLSPQEPLFALVSTFLLLYYHHPSPPLFHPSHIPENHRNDFHYHIIIHKLSLQLAGCTKLHSGQKIIMDFGPKLECN